MAADCRVRVVAKGHHFKLDQILAAYETFGSAAKTRALKVIIENA